MLNLIAAVLCVGGFGGYAVSFVLLKRIEVHILQNFYRSFLRMKNMLMVDRDFIGEAILKIGHDSVVQNMKVQSFFMKVGNDSENIREIEFGDLWRRHVEKEWLNTLTEKELYDLLYSFPGYIENCDLNSLEQSISYFLKQWEELLIHYQRKQRNNEKLVFTVCLFVGLMLSILML